MKKVKKAERGTTMVETAVVMSVLLAFMFGIIDFGRATYTYAFVAQLARQGARWAMVRGSQCTGVTPCPAQSGSSDITTYIRSLSNGATDATQLTANLNLPNGNAPGSVAEVTVSYPFCFMLSSLPAGTFTMSSTSEMIISN
jgi:Flp pilus assembly protein TadG